jgi:hypothetical protein
MKIVGIGQTTEETTNLETVKMTIDANSVDHLMINLTSLYSDPITAVVREYSSNAIDSHTKAGVSQPIEITMPTENEPNFIVRDFGVGLSKDEIANVYSRYGLSTKNGNNDEIGGFGLGCKSALAITDRFDIVSVKDGYETTAYIQKNNKGVGVVHFVSNTPTTSPNSTTITIPVEAKRISGFREATKVFDTWKVGSVLIDGESNKAVQYQEDYLPISPAGETIGWIKLNKVSEFRSGGWGYGFGLWSNIRFIIGGNAYTLEKTNFGFQNDPKSITAPLQSESKVIKAVAALVSNNPAIINLPIGSVDLTPSREAIMITEKSVATLVSSLNDFLEAVRSEAKAYIQTLDISDAVSTYANNFALFADEIDFRATHGYQNDYRKFRPETYGVSYRGEEVPTWVEVKNDAYYILESREGVALKDAQATSKIFTLNYLNGYSKGYGHASEVLNVLVQVDGSITADVLNLIKKNIRDFSKHKAETNNVNVCITNAKEINKWIVASFGEVISIDDLVSEAKGFRSNKKSVAQTGVKRSAISYPVLDLKEAKIVKTNADALGSDKNLIYIGVDDASLGTYNSQELWASVNEATRSDEVNVHEDSLQKPLQAVLGNKKIVFITRGKSVDAFLKKNPNAIHFNKAVANEVAKLNGTTDYDVLSGVIALEGTYAGGGYYYGGGKNSTLMEIAEAISVNGKSSHITDSFIKSVFTTGVNNPKMKALAITTAGIKDDKNEVITQIKAKASALNLNDKYSLLTKVSGNWSRGNLLTDEQASQAVLFINAVNSAK